MPQAFFGEVHEGQSESGGLFALHDPLTMVPSFFMPQMLPELLQATGAELPPPPPPSQPQMTFTLHETASTTTAAMRIGMRITALAWRGVVKNTDEAMKAERTIP
jgi:hypothetical protein